MPNTARMWLSGLFERHGLPSPDERPLYAYRCTETDYAELAQLTGPVLAQTIDAGALREAPGALFCLFAAEWIRRCYNGGQLRYADILAATDGPDLTYLVIQDLVKRGLRFWRRPVLRAGHAHIFLLTLACEGGLPMQFLHRDGASLRRYFRALLRDVQTYLGAGLSTETLAAQAGHYLPLSLRQESVFTLAGQVVETTLSLQSRVADASDPVAALDRLEPSWRDRFPLELSDKTAKRFLEGLIIERVAPLGQKAMRLVRSLRRTDAGWRLRAEVETPGLVPTADVSAVFGGQPTGRLELSAQCGDAPPNLVGWASPCGTGMLIERANRAPRWEDGSASEAFRLASRPQVSAHLDLNGGEALEQLPWVFVDEDATGRRLSFRGQGSIRTRFPVAWVAVKPEQQVHSDDGAMVEHVGQLLGFDRSLFRISGRVRIADGADAACAVAVGVDQAREDAYRLHGTLAALVEARHAQYLGIPRLFAIDQDGVSRPVSTTQLRWRDAEAGSALRPLDAGCIGDGELCLIEQGELRFRTRLGLLPGMFSVAYERGLTPTGGRLRLTGIAGDLGVAEPATGVTWQPVPAPRGTDTIIELRSTGEPPESVTLGIRWHGGGESHLSVPFPAGGARFMDPAGKVLLPGSFVPRDRLSGVRARVLSPTGSGRFALSASLRAPDLSPALTYAVWFRADIPRVDGAGGRIHELNLLDVADDVSTMLSASKSLDAVVELRVEGPGLGDGEGFVRIGRYDLALEPTPDGRTVQLDRASLDRVDAQSLADFEVIAFPLWAPDDGARQLQQLSSEGVPTGAWALDREALATGPWMVTARVGAWYHTRPLLITCGSDVHSSGAEVDSPDADALAGRDLAAAIRLRDPVLRERALKNTVTILRDDCLAPDWELVRALLQAFSELPPSALDLLPLLAAEPEALVLVLLKSNPNDVSMLLDMFERLPFSWRLVPIRAWLQATRRHVAGLRGQLKELDGCDEIILSSITATLGRAAERYPYFEVLQELICWDFHGWLRGAEAQYLRLASSEAGRAVLRQTLDDSHQDLLRARADGNHWPTGADLVPWLDQELRAHPEVMPVLPAVTLGTGFRKPVQYAPIAAALISVYGLEAPARTVFEIASLRTFDKGWFDEAYRLALTWMLGYQVEHCSTCWEVGS